VGLTENGGVDDALDPDGVFGIWKGADGKLKSCEAPFCDEWLDGTLP